MNFRLTHYFLPALALSFTAIISGCSPAAPSQTEITDLARSVLKKYFYTVARLSASAQADNEQMQNNAQRMFDALSPNGSSSSTPTKSREQIERDIVTQQTAEADKILNRTSIKIGKSDELGKADLIVAGSQTAYWPISFEAADPEHPDTRIAITMLAYRGTAGKWEAKINQFRVFANGSSQELPESMLKQFGL